MICFTLTGDKSVRLAVLNENGKNIKEIYTEYTKLIKDRDQTHATTLQTFDFLNDEIARLGYLIREDDGSKNYNVVYGFSIIDNQIMQAAFYFDEDEDLNWALETWDNIKQKVVNR